MSHVRSRRLAAVVAVATTALLVAVATAAAAHSHGAARPGTVVSLESTDLGRILVDAHGRTLSSNWKVTALTLRST